MRRLAFASVSLLALAVAPAAAQQPGPNLPAPPRAPSREVVAHTVIVGRGTALLAFELADGRGVQIALRNGQFRINGELVEGVGGAAKGGVAFGEAWRGLLGTLGEVEPAAALKAAREWRVTSGLSPEERAVKARIDAALAGLTRGEAVPLLPLPGLASASEGREEAADGWNVELGLGEQLGGVFGILLSLAGMGVGFSVFGRRYLDTVADTLRNAPGRAFATGLLAQLFFFPVLVLLLIGLALTIIGLVVIPFLILAYSLGAVLCLVLGMLGAAHALGESYARRRMAGGSATPVPSNLANVLRGLAMIGAFWVIAVLFGWIPLAGWVVKVLAGLVTWFVLTAGGGAVVMSRFGVRDTFAGRAAPTLTDEYLWATPVGTNPIRTVKRPGVEK